MNLTTFAVKNHKKCPILEAQAFKLAQKPNVFIHRKPRANVCSYTATN